MNFDLTAIFNANTTEAVLKIFEVVFAGLFVIYSLLTVRQVSIMNHSLVTQGVGPVVRILAAVQLLLGILVLVIIIIR